VVARNRTGLEGPGDPQGIPLFSVGLSIYHRGFPDAQWVVREVLAAESDTVIVRWRGHGTHQGELSGIPPAGKPVSVEALSLFRLRDGKVVEMWDNWDALGLMQQIDVVPTPEQAVA
jgi:predicted ester cyclase